VLGPETVSIGNVFRGTFTPDGDTLYYFKQITEGAEDYRIFRAHRVGSSWSEPERVSLGGDFSDLYPAITPDGRRMVFSSYRPAPGDTSAHPSAYLWHVEREGGSWGQPVFMPEVNEWAHYHSQPIFDARGDLYFNRSGWDYRGHSEHVSRWTGDRFGTPDTSAAWLAWRERVPAGHYLYETIPGFDGSFILLAIGQRPEGGRPGPADLHVSFRSSGGWTESRMLASGVNTSLTENFPFYSPDGRELYFVRDFARFHHLPLEQALVSDSRSELSYQAERQVTRVLFVGNSFTFGNDLPDRVIELGQSLNPPVHIETDMVASDGASLEAHWQDGEVARRLREERWDVLVLQEQGSRPLTAPALMETYVRRFAATARKSGTEVVLYQTWPRVDQPNTEQARAETYRRIAAAVGARMAPVGIAWRLARAADPGLRLHAADGVHASSVGSYLAACVLLGVLADRSPIGADASSLGRDTARVLQEFAQQAMTELKASSSRGGTSR
jgi:hypothetical protein